MVNQPIHLINKLSHIAILHRRVCVTPVAVITLHYDIDTINIQKPLGFTFNFMVRSCRIIYIFIVLLLKETLMMVTVVIETCW
jgi:hypothetical protein